MGARGKLKLPTHLRPVTDGEAAGSAAEGVPRVAPMMPESVKANKQLAKLWDEIVPQLDEAGLVAPSDGPAIELALRHFLVAREASDQIGTRISVETDEDHGGVKKNPAEAVFRLESAAFLEYAKQLGMTFVARARTPAAKGSDDGEGNPFAAPAVG
jgi:P27 family predicted phage terminase small subunit